MISPELQPPLGTASTADISDTADPVRLRLYIAGMTPNSQRAVINLDAALRETENLGRLGVEYVDVLLETRRAATESVIITPTLIAVGKKNRLVIIGDLSDAKKLRAFLKAATSFN